MAVIVASRIYREMNGQMSPISCDIAMMLMKSKRMDFFPIPRLELHIPSNSNIHFYHVNHFITQAGKQSKCNLYKRILACSAINVTS